MRVFTIHCVLKWLFFFLLAPLLFITCNAEDDGIYGSFSSEADAIKGSYVSVFISVNGNYDGRERTSTRAEGNGFVGPVGGEDGAGREDAYLREYKIHNLTLYLFKGTGVNDAPGTSIDYTITFGSGDIFALGGSGDYDESYRCIRLLPETLDNTADYQVIALANVNEALPAFTTLGQLRDYQLQTIYAKTDENDIYSYNSFTMSSESGASLKVQSAEGDNPGSYSNPFACEIVIERMAARIDFDVTNSTNINAFDAANPYYQYPVKDGEGNVVPNQYFRLRTIQVKNKLTPQEVGGAKYGTYLLKRVAAAADDKVSITNNVSYLGDETPASGAATNFVLDPWTTRKTDVASDLPVGLSYTTPTAGEVKAIVSEPTVADEKYFIVDYTMENTLPVYQATYATDLKSYLDRYATGLVFTGDYVDGSGNVLRSNVSTTYYLRHSDPANAIDDMTSDHIMKYGIVRNCIYRVKVTSAAPIEVTPSDEVNLKLEIKVKNWKKTEHDKIWM